MQGFGPYSWIATIGPHEYRPRIATLHDLRKVVEAFVG